jgi:hypothetical protein
VGGFFTLRPILEELHACRDGIWQGGGIHQLLVENEFQGYAR